MSINLFNVLKNMYKRVENEVYDDGIFFDDPFGFIDSVFFYQMTRKYGYEAKVIDAFLHSYEPSNPDEQKVGGFNEILFNENLSH